MAHFTLHHKISPPVSRHFHRPIARKFHLLIIAAASAFLSVKLYLFWIAYHDIVGSPFANPAIILLIPFFAGIAFLIGMTIFGEKFFYRELEYLRKKHRPKLEHAFRHA